MKHDKVVSELKKLIEFVEYNPRVFEDPKQSISALKQAIKTIKKVGK